MLYISGYPEDAIAHHGVLDAGQHFLQKPFPPGQFLEKVREVLRRPRRRRGVRAGQTPCIHARHEATIRVAGTRHHRDRRLGRGGPGPLRGDREPAARPAGRRFRRPPPRAARPQRAAGDPLPRRAACRPRHPEDGETIEPGRIYVAPPDRHLAIEDGTVSLSRNASRERAPPGDRRALPHRGPGLRPAGGGRGADRQPGRRHRGPRGDQAAAAASPWSRTPRRPTTRACPRAPSPTSTVDHVLPLGRHRPAARPSWSHEPRPAQPGDCAEVEEEPDDMG